MRWWNLVAFAALAALARGADAQRVDLFAYRDSLGRVSDVPSLYRLQRTLPMAGQAREVDAALVRGLVGLRIYELTGDRYDWEQAREAFVRSAERFPSVAWSHYGLALALVAAPDARVPSPGGVLDGVTVAQSFAEIFGKDARSRAKESLRRTLEVDPAFGPAATLIAELAARDGRDRGALEEAKRVLEAALAAGSTSPEVVRAIADVETALGNYGAAEAAAARSLAEGGDAGALHAHAVSLFLQEGREAEGAEAYVGGIDVLTPAAAERYYGDLDALLTRTEAADWRVADLEGRKLWLRRFWSRRAAEGGVRETDRIAEHYRRLAQARRLYLRNSVRGVDGGGALVTDRRAGNPFDERGVILIRHGEPARVLKTTQRGLLPNETWVYGRGAGSNLMFHFVALRGSRDFTLVRDLFDALDPAASLNRDDRVMAIMTLVEDRAPYEPGYQATSGRLRQALLRDEALEGTEIRTITENVSAVYRQGVRRALEADTYYATYASPLPFHYDLFTFRTPFGRTELTAAFAIPVERLTPARAGNAIEFPVRVSVILMDTLIGEVTRSDTIVRARARAVADGFVRGHVALPVNPSEHTVHRIVVEDPAAGTGQVFGGSARLRDYNHTGLMVSDLVLAEPDSVGDWTRGELHLALTLPRRFQPGRAFTLFYEIYNLRQDEPYRTDITVEPADRGGAFARVRSALGMGRDRIELRFDDVARPSAEDAVQEIRDLGSELKPGRYLLRVTVTGAETRQTATTETIFEVIG